MKILCRRGVIQLEIDQDWWLGDAILRVRSMDAGTGEVVFSQVACFAHSRGHCSDPEVAKLFFLSKKHETWACNIAWDVWKNMFPVLA